MKSNSEQFHCCFLVASAKQSAVQSKSLQAAVCESVGDLRGEWVAVPDYRACGPLWPNGSPSAGLFWRVARKPFFDGFAARRYNDDGGTLHQRNSDLQLLPPVRRATDAQHVALPPPARPGHLTLARVRSARGAYHERRYSDSTSPQATTVRAHAHIGQ